MEDRGGAAVIRQSPAAGMQDPCRLVRQVNKILC